MRTLLIGTGLALALALAAGVPTPSRAAETASCTMHFSLSGWSMFYKTAEGNGVVTCTNGQSMRVHLRAKGGGLTVGETHITDGVGKFTGVNSIDEVLGHYATAEAHAGTEDSSAKAQVMTKGNVSLALTGKGKGWNLGVAFGAFIIERGK
jgi:hypothetical protein